MIAERQPNSKKDRAVSTEMHLFLLQQDVKIVTSPNMLAKASITFGKQIINTGILPEGQALIADAKFIVHDPPIYHYDENGEKTSDAEYYVDEHETPEGHIVYLSRLRPHSTTSKHQHPHPLREFYFLLHGEAFQGDELMKPRSIINPFEDHQVTTREQSALLLIFMENGASVPKDQRHIMQHAH